MKAKAYIQQTYGGGRGGAEGEKTKKVLWFTWQIGNSPSADSLDFLCFCTDVEVTNMVDNANFVVAHGSGILQGPKSNEQSFGNALSSAAI